MTGNTGTGVGRSAHKYLLNSIRDAVRVLPFVLGLLLVFRQEARAYADPGTGALIWQALAAGFVGLLFYVRRFTTWFKTSKRKESKD